MRDLENATIEQLEKFIENNSDGAELVAIANHARWFLNAQNHGKSSRSQRQAIDFRWRGRTFTVRRINDKMPKIKGYPERWCRNYTLSAFGLVTFGRYAGEERNWILGIFYDEDSDVRPSELTWKNQKNTWPGIAPQRLPPVCRRDPSGAHP